MAKAEISMPTDFLDRLSRLGERIDDVSEKVLIAGGEVIESQVRDNLKGVIGRNTKYESQSTGQLLSSLGKTSVRVDDDGNSNIKIGFSEHRTDGVSNAMLANILEYGKHGQAAKPFMKPAVKSAKKACEQAMVSTFESEVDKI